MPENKKPLSPGAHFKCPSCEEKFAWPVGAYFPKTDAVGTRRILRCENIDCHEILEFERMENNCWALLDGEEDEPDFDDDDEDEDEDENEEVDDDDDSDVDAEGV